MSERAETPPPDAGAFLRLPMATTGRPLWPIAFFLLLYLGAMAFSAILSPFVYWGMGAWAAAGGPDWVAGLASKDFARYFDRLRWLPVLIGLPWIAIVCGLKSWKAWGLAPSRAGFRQLGESFFWGGLMMLGVVALANPFLPICLFQGAALTPLEILSWIPMALLGAALLGLLEEVVFRGLVLRLFTTAMSLVPAVLLASAFFAAVHFKSVPDEVWEPGGVTWVDGWRVAWATLIAPLEAHPLRLLILFLAGILLSLVVIQWRSLWPAIGLHAGWVFIRAAEGEWLARGAFDLTDPVIGGIQVGILLVAIGFLMWGLLQRRA